MMRKTIKKLFWAWEFEKEEAWLNELAARGLCLVAVGWCRYEFEECQPGAYSIRLELLENQPGHPESEKYLAFLDSTGAGHIGSYMRWVYLRKKKSDEEFSLFSDNFTRIKHLTRIMRLILTLGLLNLLAGAYNLFLFFAWESAVNGIGIFGLLFGLFILIGYAKLHKQRARLKADQQLFE